MFAELFEGFWGVPEISCPKCRGKLIEYYDPFFFSPIRTLKGHRRLRCQACHFIWRPSRSGKSVWDHFRHGFYP